MTGDYLEVLLVVGAICGAFQVLILWDGRFRRKKDGLYDQAAALSQLFVEWVAYMLVFGALSLSIYEVIGFLCGYCSAH